MTSTKNGEAYNYREAYNANLTAGDITEFLQSLPDPYSRIAEKKKKPPIPRNGATERFAAILEDVGYISSADPKGDIIRINTFTN